MRKVVLFLVVMAFLAGLAAGVPAQQEADLREDVEESRVVAAPESPDVYLEKPVALGGASCTQECRDEYYLCEDECGQFPYPGCTWDCRKVLYACYESCL